MIKKLDKINGDIEAIHEFNSGELNTSRHSDDDDNVSLTCGPQEASSHLTDEPGRGKTQKTHQGNGREWTDQKHEPDGTNPEHIDLNNVSNLARATAAEPELAVAEAVAAVVARRLSIGAVVVLADGARRPSIARGRSTETRHRESEREREREREKKSKKSKITIKNWKTSKMAELRE